MDFSRDAWAGAGSLGRMLQQGLAVGVLAFALGASLLSSGWGANDEPVREQSRQLRHALGSPQMAKPAPVDRVVYFVVESRLAADAIRAQLNQDVASDAEAIRPFVTVLLTDSPEALQTALNVVREQQISAVSFDIIDMRQR